MRGIHYPVFVIIFLFLSFLVQTNQSWASDQQKVLLLHSYHPGYKWTDDITTIIKGKLNKQSGVDLRIEYLDSKRYISRKYLELFTQTLMAKYETDVFDVIICSDNNALAFLLSCRDTLFPNIPIVFCGINFFDPKMIQGVENITGINEHTDALQTIRLMIRIHPETKKIIVVNDDTTTGKILAQEIKTITNQFSGVKFLFTENYSFSRLQHLLSNLQEGDLVLQSLFIRDNDGLFMEYDSAARFMTDSSTVPVYSLWDFNLGTGVVGGLMISAGFQGEHAANLALQILNGKPVKDIAIIMKSPNHYFADYAVLERFDISSSDFPQDTIIINKPESLYAKHRTLFLSIGILLIILFFTSLFLFISVVKRKRIEKTLRKTTAQLDQRVKQRTVKLTEAKQELEKQKDQLNFLLDNLSGMAFRCCNDEQRTMVFVSQAITDLTGYTAEELIDNNIIPFNQLIISKDQETLKNAILSAIKKQDRFSCEYRIVKKNGQIIWVWEQGTIVFDSDDRVKYIDSFISNISHRKAMEREQAKLSEAVYQTDDLVIITDMAGAIEYVNPAFESVTGYTLDEVAGNNPRLLKSGKQPDDFYRGMWKSLLSADVFRGRVVNRKKDGTEYMADITISPIRNRRDELTSYVGVQRDITKEIALEEQLRQSQKLEAVGTLAEGLAHELNTPAQFVGSNLDFLQEGIVEFTHFIEECMVKDASGDEGEDALKTVYEERDLEYFIAETPLALQQSRDGIKQISQIVESMKQLTRPGENHATAADINLILENCGTICRNKWRDVADLTYDFDDRVPLIQCYQAELSQVFHNMITNAAHSLKPQKNGAKGKIEVKTTMAGKYIEVRITDNGSGISEEIQSKIFDPFFTTKEPGQGTGQGLAVAYTVINDKHGGEISFKTTPGKGTTFLIRLPVKT